MKLNRLAFAEFIKAIKRQGILGMIAVLAIVLTLCALIYQPKLQDDFRINILKETPTQIYNEFNETDLKLYENALLSELNRIDYYINFSTNQKAKLIARIDEIRVSISTLNQLINAPTFDKIAAKNCVLTLREQLVNFNVLIADYFHVERVAYYVDQAKLTQISDLINSIVDIIPASFPDNTQITWYVATRNSIGNKDIHTKLVALVNSLEAIEYFPVELTIIKAKVQEFETGWKAEILETIQFFLAQHPTSSEQIIKDQFNGLLTKYIVAIKTMTQYLNTSLFLELAGSKSDTQLQKYVGFANYNSYVTRNNQTKAEFLLENKIFLTQVQDTVPFNYSSSFQTNAFDFAFFATEVTAMVILIFSILFITGMISGEQSAGNMKMLAIRPYSRTKIIRSKMRATMAITVLSLFLSFIVSLGIGFYIFGVSFTPFLVVFNAGQAFLLYPALLSLIYIAAISIKIMVYVSLAGMLSVLTRSTSGTVIISFVSYLLVLILNSSLYVYPIYSYLPFINFDLFKFFGGGMVGAESSGLLSIFSSPILNNANFYYSLGLTLTIIIAFQIAALIKFKNKDIT